MGSARNLIVLDTNAWLFWLHDPERLSPEARERVRSATQEDCALVSVISVWEVALKNALGKLALPMEIGAWLERAVTYPGISIESLGPREAIGSTRLPGAFHKDPADRFIVSLARNLGVPLVTADEKIRAYPHVETPW
ncbi:MAG: type II toxin-antitoxin system VapC family toxin [Polyangia bacterium]